jgi:crotonobetainyl-CoA:carnitine CoA-transferase CaiB-like acyl-CoA transferase
VRGQSAYWVQYNSGKKSLAINLRTEKGKEVLRDLVKVSDILLQNFRPGTIDIMGFGYDKLKELNPKIIMINVSAYGQYGPNSEKVGFDPIGQAMGGLMSLTGYGDLPPIKTYFPLIDRITALHACIGALAALREREISGEGQALEVCLADTGFTVNEIPISAYLSGGVETTRADSAVGGGGTPFGGMYETSDGYVILAAGNDNMWPRTCDALGHPEWLEDPRFETRDSRTEHVDVLEKEIGNWLKQRTTKQAVDELSEHSIPCAPVNTTEQAANEPQLHEREILMEVPDPVAGTMWVSGKSIKFSRTPMVVGSTPTVGQHTRELLTDILDYSDDQVQALVDEEVVGADDSV